MPRKKRIPDISRMCRKAYPEYFSEFLPHVARASKYYLDGEPTRLMLLAHEDIDAALSLLGLADGFLDMADGMLQASFLDPVSPEQVRDAIRLIDESPHSAEIRAEAMPFTFAYFARNPDVIPGFTKLLDRYARMADPTPLRVAIKWPQLAGCSPNELSEFANRHPEAMSYHPMHELAHAWHEATLVATFGSQWRRWLGLRHFGGADPDDFHQVYMATSFLFKEIEDRIRPRSSFRDLGNFILRNLDLGLGNLSFIAHRWEALRDDVLSPGFRDEIQGMLEREWREEFGWDLTGDPATDEVLSALSSAGIKQPDFQRIVESIEGMERAPLPDWARIDPFKVGRYRARFLPRDDMRAPLIGIYTGCCQHINGEAASCALHSCVSPLGAAFVVEDPKRPANILAASWVWSDGEGIVVFDSVEGPVVRGVKDSRTKHVVAACRKVSSWMFETGLARSVLMGTVGYGLRPEMLDDVTRWRHGPPKEPPDYDRVTEMLKTMNPVVRKYRPDSFTKKLVLAGRKHPRWGRKEEAA